MNQHTAGPWYVGAQNDILYVIDRPPRPSNDDVNPNQDVGVIAKIYRPREGTFAAEQANANLLAAAPDLLEACKGLEELLSAHEWGEGPARRAAQAAIKKATGGPS